MSWKFFNSPNYIDLRSELHALLYGGNSVGPYGMWVILRRYDLTKYSKYYNQITKEGIDGPKFEYKDELYLTYKWHSWVNDPFTEQQMQAGQLSTPLVTFFFEYNVNPKEQDEIYEFEWADHTVKPSLLQIAKPYKHRYDIKNVQDYRLEGGRVEFYACKSIKEIIHY